MKKTRHGILIVCALILAQTVTAQESEEDREYIKETIEWLNRPYEEDIKKAKADPFFMDEMSGYTSGKVYYLPGDRYKIFFFQGQDCEKRCGPIYYCTTMPAEQMMEEPYEIDMEPITAIHQLADGDKFLIIQGSDIKASLEVLHCASASVLVFENDEPKFEMCFLEGNDKNTTADAQGKAFACSSTFVEESTFIQFQSDRNKLVYRYQTYTDEMFVREGKFMDIYGEYTYENGYFILGYQEIKDKVLPGE